MRSDPTRRRAARRFDQPEHVLISGASAGIGAALATAYAGPGVTLSLIARRAAPLEAIAAACRAAGAQVTVGVLDVTDAAATQRWVRMRDTVRPIDLAIANAGSGEVETRSAWDETARAQVAVHIEGLFNTIHPLIEPMRGRGRGQLALMSSLGSLRGSPGLMRYGAAKGFVRLYGEGLRGELATAGIGVSVILPGFVRTAMVAGEDSRLPLLMEPATAARIIRRRLADNPARIAFPWPLYRAAQLWAAWPRR